MSSTSFPSQRLGRRLILSTLMALIVPTLASGQIEPNPRFHSNEQVSEMLLNLVTYGSVARACKHNTSYYDLKTTLVQALEVVKRKSGFTSLGKKLYRDPEIYLSLGTAEYRSHPYVTCGWRCVVGGTGGNEGRRLIP